MSWVVEWLRDGAVKYERHCRTEREAVDELFRVLEECDSVWCSTVPDDVFDNEDRPYADMQEDLVSGARYFKNGKEEFQIVEDDR